MNKFLKNTLGNWPWLLTGLVIFFAIILILKTKNLTTAANIGDFVAGFAATLAFIWLIAGFFQQRKELELQRNELSLQRTSLDLQKDEIRKIGKYNALSQIERMLENFNASLPARNLPNVTATEHLNMLFMNGWTSTWKTILNSKDPQHVIAAYNQWSIIEAVCNQFLSIVVSALNLYVEATEDFFLARYKEEDTEATVIYMNGNKLSQIPHLQKYSGTANALAQDIFLMGPGIKRVRLAGFSAIKQLYPGVVRE